MSNMPQYDILISELKLILSTIGIKYSSNKNTCMQNIDNKAKRHNWRSKTIKKTKDLVDVLINRIDIEQERVATSMENKLNNLTWLNSQLILFSREAQQTINKARQLLKTINTNIYDLEVGLIKEVTYEELKNDLKKPNRRFPLHIAKSKITLKCFLKKCFS